MTSGVQGSGQHEALTHQGLAERQRPGGGITTDAGERVKGHQMEAAALAVEPGLVQMLAEAVRPLKR